MKKYSLYVSIFALFCVPTKALWVKNTSTDIFHLLLSAPEYCMALNHPVELKPGEERWSGSSRVSIINTRTGLERTYTDSWGTLSLFIEDGQIRETRRPSCVLL